MASLTSAKQRLEQAVSRLESAVQSASVKEAEESRVEILESERAELDAQLTTLRGEHQSLERRLSTAQGDYEALEKVMDQVSDRLDATIGRLREVLEG